MKQSQGKIRKSRKLISSAIHGLYRIYKICFHTESYLAFGENSLTLHLVSKLPDLRVANAKWIRRTSSSSHSISAPYEIENFIRRDIEVVITGLTRNQFVRKHTRVRIPLSPPKQDGTPKGVPFLLCENINGIRTQ